MFARSEASSPPCHGARLSFRGPRHRENLANVRRIPTPKQKFRHRADSAVMLHCQSLSAYATLVWGRRSFCVLQVRHGTRA